MKPTFLQLALMAVMALVLTGCPPMENDGPGINFWIVNGLSAEDALTDFFLYNTNLDTIPVTPIPVPIPGGGARDIFLTFDEQIENIIFIFALGDEFNVQADFPDDFTEGDVIAVHLFYDDAGDVAIEAHAVEVP